MFNLAQGKKTKNKKQSAILLTPKFDKLGSTVGSTILGKASRSITFSSVPNAFYDGCEGRRDSCKIIYITILSPLRHIQRDTRHRQNMKRLRVSNHQRPLLVEYPIRSKISI